MNILIAGSVQGDGSYEEAELCLLLERELRAAGHMVDRFLLPYERNILSLPEQILAYSLLEIHSCDLLITVGYPACVLRHPNKVCYLLQMEPMLAEYWDSPYGVLANLQYSNLLFSVQDSNRSALREAKSVFCCSQLLAEDIQKTYEIQCRILLYPALEDTGGNDAEQVDVLCESSLLPWQRPELLLELFSAPKTREKRRAKLFVPNAHLIYREQIERLIARNGLSDCVMLVERRATETDVRNAEAVFIPDFRSRRIPNIALEAISCGKPVLCMGDAGAVASLVPAKNQVEEAALPGILIRMTALSAAADKLPNADTFAKELIG